MKLKNLLRYLMFFVAGTFLFACNSGKQYEYATNYGGYHPSTFTTAESVKPVNETEKVKAQTEETEILEANNQAVPAPVITSEPVWKVNPQPTVEKVASSGLATTEKVAASKNTADYTKPVLNVKKHTKKRGFFSKIGQKIKAASTNILEVILAIFLPPVAVFLHDGIGTQFWISLILTLLIVTFLFAIIHAFLVITDNI